MVSSWLVSWLLICVCGRFCVVAVLLLGGLRWCRLICAVLLVLGLVGYFAALGL